MRDFAESAYGTLELAVHWGGKGSANPSLLELVSSPHFATAMAPARTAVQVWDALGGSIGPDLSITYLQVYVQAGLGQTLYIIDVTNNGDEVANAFDVGVFSDLAFPPAVGAGPDEVQTVASLLPGDTAPLSVVIRSTPSAFWQSYVLADPDGLIAEPNESNNLGAFSVFP